MSSGDNTSGKHSPAAAKPHPSALCWRLSRSVMFRNRDRTCACFCLLTPVRQRLDSVAGLSFGVSVEGTSFLAPSEPASLPPSPELAELLAAGVEDFLA